MINNIVTDKIAEHAYGMTKYAGIKRVERIITSLSKKSVGGKKALTNIMDMDGPFASAHLSLEAAKRPHVKIQNKGLVDALSRSTHKLDKRISRFAGGDDEYANKLFTQFRGYGHLDTIGRRLLRLAI